MSMLTRSLRSLSGPPPNLNALAGCSYLSTSSRCSANRQVLLELLEDVEGLGQRHDRVMVQPGRAQNQLVPARLARYHPWKRASQRQPYRHTSEMVDVAILEETASPAIPTSFQPSRDISAILSALPKTLVFPQRTVSPTSETLHGSVTLADVSARLAEDYGLMAEDATVSWRDRGSAERMKELGRWDVVISRGEGEEVEGTVEAVRLLDA